MENREGRILWQTSSWAIFSAPDAVKYRGLTAVRLQELGVEFVDIDDINDEGLLYDENDRLKILENLKPHMWTASFCPTAISAQNTCAPDWQKTFISRCFSGAPWTRGPSQMACGSATPSADCLPPERFSGVLACHLPT